jgi:pimeloyl-ACP methyl ester carboxylesterase
MSSVTQSRNCLAFLGRAVFRRVLMFGLPAVLAIALAPPAHAEGPSAQNSVAPKVIVIGFVGGFVRSDDDRHPEVQIAERLSEEDITGVRAAVFENARWVNARNEILHWLDTDGDGRLSEEEKQDAHIILYGHSWGGSAVIRLARDLNRRGIPVTMTIQVDSINKLSGHDCLIPPNVGAALNFYQTHGLAHGCQTLHAVDSSRTRILGSYRFDYTSQPVECRSFSWTNRHFLKTHEATDCDPRIWTQIDQQIRARIGGIVQPRPADPKPKLDAAGLSGARNPTP